MELRDKRSMVGATLWAIICKDDEENPKFAEKGLKATRKPPWEGLRTRKSGD